MRATAAFGLSVVAAVMTAVVAPMASPPAMMTPAAVVAPAVTAAPAIAAVVMAGMTPPAAAVAADPDGVSLLQPRSVVRLRDGVLGGGGHGRGGERIGGERRDREKRHSQCFGVSVHVDPLGYGVEKSRALQF